MEWLFVKSTPVKDAAYFTPIKNYPKQWELGACLPLRDKIPPEAEIRMDPNVPKDIKLVDSLYSSDSVLFVNERVCKLFESQGIQNVEYLPIKVIDHKQKPVKEPYFIVNILTKADCIDVQASQITWNTINTERISGVKSLVLNSKLLPTDVKFFRPVRMPYVMLIHRSVADQIRAEGLLGFRFQEVSEFHYP